MKDKFVDKPTRVHTFISSRMFGECAGCIYPENHLIHRTGQLKKKPKKIKIANLQ